MYFPHRVTGAKWERLRSKMHKIEAISAVILASNEEPNISYCLESIRQISNIYVVDSGSTDSTVSICERFGAQVFHHAYANHANQWQWALDNLPILTPWILALDADFVVTRELLDRISREIDTLNEDIGGIYVRHLYNFGWGRIRFGGTKKYWLRIVRRGCARPDTSDLVDFRFLVDRHVVRWPEAVIEHNHKDDDISTWITKQDSWRWRRSSGAEDFMLGIEHLACLELLMKDFPGFATVG
jgi:glycosyltransferase involved in cell wall biosynthesis